MADIIYDIEKIVRAKDAIDKLIDNLDNDNTSLTNALEELKTGWNTEAGKKFFNENKDTWTEYVKKYVKKLTGVSDMLQKAIEHYEIISDEVKNLVV